MLKNLLIKILKTFVASFHTSDITIKQCKLPRNCWNYLIKNLIGYLLDSKLFCQVCISLRKFKITQNYVFLVCLSKGILVIIIKFAIRFRVEGYTSQ